MLKALRNISFICLILNCYEINAQVGKHTIIGISTSFIPDQADFDERLKHLEVSAIVNFMTSIHKYYYVGLEYVHTTSIGSVIYEEKDPSFFHTISIINHFNIYNSRKIRLFVQGQVDYSNYFHSTHTYDPVRRPLALYAGWGSGLNIRVNSKMTLDFAFKYSYLLDREDVLGNPLPMLYWTAGINYDLIRD